MRVIHNVWDKKLQRSNLLTIIGLLVAFGLGMVLSKGFISPFRILMLLIGFLFFLWVLIKPHIGVFAAILLVFIPFSVGSPFNIPDLEVAEVGIPVITIVYFLFKIIKRKPILIFKSSMNPLLIPILLYFGVVFTNYLRNPLPSSSVLGIPQEAGGLRVYYEFFLSFCAYLVFGEAVSSDMKIIQGIKGFLWQICLVLCLLGIVLIFSYPVQNILYSLQNRGIFSFAFFSAAGAELLETRYRLFSGGYRIGTLGEVAPICLLLLLAGAKKVNGLSKWILYGFLWFGLILSGARGSFVGTILALCLWLVLRKSWRALPLLFVTGFIIYICVFVYYDILPSQLQRMFKIRGSLEQMEVYRGMLFPLFWSSFLGNPVFGVGMGGVEIYGTGITRFLTQQLRFGGHGTYLSLLYTTGLLGFIPFIWVYLSGIKTSLYVFNRASNKMIKTLSLFCLLYLIYDSVPLGFGGLGASISLFMVLGIISGFYLNQQPRNVKNVYEER